MDVAADAITPGCFLDVRFRQRCNGSLDGRRATA
jgi:hypothetical protein